MSSTSQPRPAPSRGGLFLDRDGTLIEDGHYLARPADVRLLPGVAGALQRARNLGYRLYLFTNQSGVGRGYFTRQAVDACNARLLQLAGLTPGAFERVCIAPEAPGSPSRYRKPSPAFIEETLEADGLDPGHTWMVGDKLADLQAGIGGGIRAAFVETGKPRTSEVDAFLCEHHPRAAAYPGLAALVDTLPEAPRA